MARLTAKYGRPESLTEYFGKSQGSWRAVPASWGSAYYPAVTRIDLFRQYVDLDVQAMSPVGTVMGSGYEQWTWHAFLMAAEKCFKAGYPFGLPVSSSGDASQWLGALFRSFGAILVDANGNITARSDSVRAVLDYARRLATFLPSEVYSWDNASNNRALIGGKSALIFNPASAWAGAVSDNLQVGERLWHHSLPAGEHGRFVPFVPNFWGVWNFSKNKTAAKELIEWLSEREQVERACVASRGNDVPPFPSMIDFPIWVEAGPPKGTLFNYPIRPSHQAAPCDPGWPAPLGIANQISVQATAAKMVARFARGGMSVDETIAETEQELEGFMR